MNVGRYIHGVYCLASRGMQKPGCLWANDMVIDVNTVSAVGEERVGGIILQNQRKYHTRSIPSGYTRLGCSTPYSSDLCCFRRGCCCSPRWDVRWDVHREVLEASKGGP